MEMIEKAKENISKLFNLCSSLLERGKCVPFIGQEIGFENPEILLKTEKMLKIKDHITFFGFLAIELGSLTTD